MAQLHVSLSDDLSDWAQSRATQERFVDAAAYVQDVVRRDREQVQRLARLQSAIDQGRASPLSDRTIEDIIADGRQRHAAR